MNYMKKNYDYLLNFHEACSLKRVLSTWRHPQTIAACIGKVGGETGRMLVLIWLLVFSVSVSAQTDVKFKRFSHDQGLSMNDIRAITQDSQGFIWIGTLDGLNKFNGYTFKVYKNNPADTASLSNNTIWALLEGSDNHLYIGTDDGGLNVYDKELDVFVRYQHNPKDRTSIGANEVSALFEDSRGTVWVGTDGGGLNIFNRQTRKFARYTHNQKDQNSLSSNVIKSIAEDQEGNLWIGTDKGISVLGPDRKKFKNYQHNAADPASLGSDAVLKIFVDSENKKWVGTFFGLYLFNDKQQNFTPYLHDQNNPNSILGNYVPDLFESPQDGHIWIATNFGISVLDKKTGAMTQHTNDTNNPLSLIDNGLNTLYLDKTSNIWVGSYAGLCMKEGGKAKFKHFTHDPRNASSLMTKEVNGFYQDKRGNIWVAVRDGFDLFNKATNTFTNHNPFTDQELVKEVFTFYEDTRKNFWIGAQTGLYLYNRDNGRVESFRETNPGGAPTIVVGDVWYIQEDSKGNIWISSLSKGVFRLDVKTKSLHPLTWPGKYIPNKDVFSFYIDGEDTFWIGTALEGLFKVNQARGEYAVYKKSAGQQNSLSSNFILTTYEDSKGNFWVGTRAGLNLLDRNTNTVTNYTEIDGLPNSVINSLLEDKAGKLWLGTYKGISRFDPQAKTFTNYTVDDGLQHTDFWHRSALKLSGGEFLFGGMNGFNLFHPDSLQPNSLVPQVYLTDFQIFNKQVIPGSEDSPLEKHISATKAITLSHKQSVFSFEFVGLNYIISKKNQYAYKLEGFDKDWNYVGSHRSATYTNLDPGEYTFKVKASNNDGVWNETGTALSVVVTPPYWQTWWFRALAVLLIVGGAVSFYRVRLNAVKAQKAELERQVQEQTADLRLANVELTERQEEILQQQEEMQAQAELLQQINGDLQQSQVEIAQQRDHLKIINEQVMSSIQYAQTIQKAILPAAPKMAEVFREHFTLYRPKDVVSGDFYWLAHLSRETSGLPGDLSFMAVVDCTGHGVPGAFMSIIGSTILSEIVNQKRITDPGQILELLHEGVKQAVTKTEGINTAGMDVCLCQLERGEGNSVRILFSGAKRDLMYVEKGRAGVQKLVADRRSIGGECTISFTTQELVLEAGSMLYLTTDGYIDQNNPAREKLGTNTLLKHLEQICTLSAAEQQQLLEQALDEHQQGCEQRDDITIVGIQL